MKFSHKQYYFVTNTMILVANAPIIRFFIQQDSDLKANHNTVSFYVETKQCCGCPSYCSAYITMTQTGLKKLNTIKRKTQFCAAATVHKHDKV